MRGVWGRSWGTGATQEVLNWCPTYFVGVLPLTRSAGLEPRPGGFFAGRFLAESCRAPSRVGREVETGSFLPCSLRRLARAPSRRSVRELRDVSN
jgi:hypothetical protein